MADQQPPSSCQVLWNLDDIQQFIGPTQCCVRDYTHELLTLDTRSNLIQVSSSLSSISSSSDVTRKQSSTVSSITHHGENEAVNVMSSEDETVRDHQDIVKSNDLASASNQTDTSASVTTLGLLLLATITYQNKSNALKESINKISEFLTKQSLQEVAQNYPHSKKLTSLSGLQSFVNFCIGHCVLWDADGPAVKDVGVLQVWCDVVEPLRILVEKLVIDHIQENEIWNLPFPQPANVSSLKSYLNSQKAAIYAKFHSYDFTHDAPYQAGVQQVMKQLQAEGAGRDSNRLDLELEAKLFYFSRFFDKVSKEDYQKWLSQQQETSARLKMVVQDPNTEDVTLPVSRQGEDPVSRSRNGDHDPNLDRSKILPMVKPVQSLPTCQYGTSAPSTFSSTTSSDLLMEQSEDQLPSTQTLSGVGARNDTPAPRQSNTSSSLTSTSSDLLMEQSEDHQPSIQTLSCVGDRNGTPAPRQSNTSSSLTSPSSDLLMEQCEDHQLSTQTLSSGIGDRKALPTPRLVPSNFSASSLSATSASGSSNLQMQSSDHLSSVETFSLSETEDISAVKCKEGDKGISGDSPPSGPFSSDTFVKTIPHSDSAAADSSSRKLQDITLDPSEINSDPMNSAIDHVNSDPPPYPASFLEILKLVESGQEIPGIEILDIKPTEAPLTESKMKPLRKPWQK
ncbi:uncharacterized protein [Amphiura filiformis]|uniref:uncharacterized protein n=1 Tax=Amphiura filiformis TaxID=82378 RepID=UPI003B220CE3